MVLLAVVGSILLVGVVLLAVWKLVITVHDWREFSRFQSARSRARYEMVRIDNHHFYKIILSENVLVMFFCPPQASNPLYKQPVPTHDVETDFSMYGKPYNGGLH